MNKGYYIVKMINKKRYWLAGPFLDRQQAQNNVSRFEEFDVSSCPKEFVSWRKFDCKEPGFIMVAVQVTRDEPRKSWFGDCISELIPKNLF